MFLKNLNSEEKNAFLCLANTVINVDGSKTGLENDLLQSFADEMGISLNNCNFENQDAYKTLNDISNTKKRSIYMELMSLAYIDSNYNESEKQCLLNIKGKLGLPDEFVEKAEKWLVSYLNHVQIGFGIIEGQ